MIRRWIIGATLVIVASAFACAELVGVHDLTCGSEGGSPDPCGDGYVPPPPCVPDGGPFDTCVADGGVAILPASGELHGVAWAFGTIVAVGYDDLDGGGQGFAVRVISDAGGVVEQIVEDAGVANGATVDTTSNGVWVAGGDGTRFMVRHYDIPLKLSDTSNPTLSYDEKAPLAGAVVVVPLGSDETAFGTTASGDLVIERLHSGADPFHSALYNGALGLHATSGVVSSGLPTILGDTPDAALGLAMARWQNGSGGPSLDPSFGDGGGLVAKFGDGGSARSLLLASDSSYWVGGVAVNDTGFVFAHVTDAGVLDRSWTTTHAEAGINAMLAVDGGVLAAGFADGNLAVARFTLDAGLDKTFGDAGVLEIPLPGELKAIVQTDNRYVVGGFTTKSGTKQWVLVWLVP